MHHNWSRELPKPRARRLAQDGFAVAVLDLKADDCADTVSAIEAAGGTALAVGADVSVRRSAELLPPSPLASAR